MLEVFIYIITKPDQPNLKAKTPALINTMRNSIVT